MNDTEQVSKLTIDFDVQTGMPTTMKRQLNKLRSRVQPPTIIGNPYRVEDAEAELVRDQAQSDKKAEELHNARI